MPKRGFLFINLGTPQSLSYKDLYCFLADFLSDWRVLDLPAIIRYPLVYGFIAPLRPWKIRKGYQKIWSEGSPLMQHSLALVSAIKEKTKLPVALGMTYQKPSIENGLKELTQQGCTEIIVLPLFPQYAAASSGASIAAVYHAAARFWDPPAVHVIKDFYQDTGFIQSQAKLIKKHFPQACDLVVVSFHGVPVRQIKKSGCAQAEKCQEQECPFQEQTQCYRAQSFQTARKIAAAISWDGPLAVAFQSRLGSIPWIKPYLDQSLQGWAEQGIKNLVIISASFTADCLETLEEIDGEIREQWAELTHGQGQLTAIPCLNSDQHWIETLSSWALKMAAADYRL